MDRMYIRRAARMHGTQIERYQSVSRTAAPLLRQN
jgi:hypothetical protein